MSRVYPRVCLGIFNNLLGGLSREFHIVGLILQRPLTVFETQIYVNAPNSECSSSFLTATSAVHMLKATHVNWGSRGYMACIAVLQRKGMRETTQERLLYSLQNSS